MKIFKYELSVIDRQHISLPYGAKVLSLQVQRNKPYIWVLVNPHSTFFTKHTFITVGTGHEALIDDTEFLGTYQLSEGALVFHVFKENVFKENL